MQAMTRPQPLRPAERAPDGGEILVAEGFDHAIRWRAGDRLQDLFERRCRDVATRDALEVDGERVTFAELDRRANQMARYLLSEGFGAGDRIGLIIDRSIEAYAARARGGQDRRGLRTTRHKIFK